MRRLAPLFVLALILGVASFGCATDEPRYAPPPPGSHSPFSAPDERGTGDPMRDSPDEQPRPEQDEEEPEEPPPERD